MRSRRAWSVAAKLGDKGQALVFGPGTNPIAFVSARDVAAVADLAVRDPSLRCQVLEVAGPEQVSSSQLADRLVAASGRPGHVRHIPLLVLRAMSVLARPVTPALARQARASVVMQASDMTADGAAIGDRSPPSSWCRACRARGAHDRKFPAGPAVEGGVNPAN